MNRLFMILFSLLLFSCKEAKKTEPEIDSQPYSKSEIQEPTPVLDKQEEPIKIIPIEHATAVIEWKDLTIYVDPVGGAERFKEQKSPDLILVTDEHGDHFNLETIEGLNTEAAKIIMPQAVAYQMPDQFTPQIDVLNNGDIKERFGITVKAIPMYNLRKEAQKFHQRGRGNGYVLTLGEKRLYFSGDTEDIPEMRTLKDIDIAFVCMNLPYTMTVERAADAVLEFKPKKVYPYHYRGRPEVSDVTKFKNLVQKADANIEVVLLDWYPDDDF